MFAQGLHIPVFFGRIQGSTSYTWFMTPAPEPVVFRPDSDSKKKGGLHRPRFSPVFSCESIGVIKPSKVHLMVNPYSGKKKGDKVANRAQSLLEEAGIEVVVHRSTHPSHLVQLAANIDSAEDDIFAVVGGDGSMSEVITGLMRNTEDRNPPIVAFIPAGTGNSHAYDLKIEGLEDAVDRIVSGRVQKLDISRVTLTEGLPGFEKGEMTWYSHNLVTWGLGIDSNLIAERMRFLGPIRYDVGIVMSILRNRRRQAKLILDGHVMESDFTLFLIQNTQTGGSGLPLAPGASIDDGLMDIGILNRMPRGAILKAFGLLKKEGRHVFHPSVVYHRFKSLRIETPEPTAINIDGENIGTTPMEMTVLPSALRLLV